MAYTGSGTQADPYLVDNGYDLLQLCDGSHENAYIKVTQTIDFAQESWYTGKVTSTISLKGGKLYADSLTEIRGLTIEHTRFIKQFTNSQTIENLYFKNCCLKVNANNFAVFDFWTSGTSAPSSTKQANINNCKFSILVVSGGNYGCLFFSPEGGSDYPTNYNNCSFYIKMKSTNYITIGTDRVNSNTPRQPRCYSNFTNCNIVLDGIYLDYVASDATTAILYALNTNYGTYWQFKGSSTSLVITDGHINCYSRDPAVIYITTGTFASQISGCSIIFDNCTIAQSSTDVYPCSRNTTDNMTVIASTQNVYIDTSYNIKKISTTNIKDKNYLVDIGFLP